MATKNFDWVQVTESIRSSYKQNQLGWWFYSLARTFNLTNVVEVGVLGGYSAIYTMAGMPDYGYWKGYDLWTLYPYNHVSRQEAFNNIFKADLLLDDFDLDPYGPLENVHKHILEPVDMIHVDVSNDGDTYKWCLEHLFQCIKPGGFLVMEGGTIERDLIEWMKKRTPIVPIVDFLHSTVDTRVFQWELWCKVDRFPGITVFRR
ncbi:MAG: hypothetical protein GF334_00685 [Candidatus Altiarchaeales archaeon]|nr:hypothetical protein [Candidatus Altiarchaeales archaeon]